MTLGAYVSPQRRALNPVLSDDALVGMEGSSVAAFYTPSAQRIAQHVELIVAGSAGLCLAAAAVLRWTVGPQPLQHLFTLLAFAIAGIPSIEAVWGKIRDFRIDIDVLMLLGAGLAAYIGSPFEGALLLFLFALSGGLEGFALRRTQAAIVALRSLAPKEATLIEGENATRVPLRQVSVGARVLIRPGETVPLDGTVLDGASSLNEAALTGESIPRPVAVGAAVFAGTQNIDGRLEVQVTKLAADTTLARIVKLITEARQRPARAQRLIDQIGPTYSTAAIVGAVAVGLVCGVVFGVETNEAVRRGIAVLIVASPCALIIATPVAYLSAIAAAARRGVLVKGGVHLETVARAVVVVFDKTGTLTTGRLRLTDVEAGDGLSESYALQVVGAVERSSNHPLAAAVRQALTDRQLTPLAIADYSSVPGQGAGGIVDGRRVWVGRPEHASVGATGTSGELPTDALLRLRASGKTVSAMVVESSIGLLAFQDTIRDGAADCVQQLRRQGIRRVEMLTGDHEIVARNTAEKLKLDGYQAELTPEEKLIATRRLQEQLGPVVLVGDGINDAPALAHADVGVAMGGIGADVAMEAADIVLLKDHIESVAWLHTHALRTARIVRQNLTIAIAVMVVLSVFAALGNVPLPLAVVGHEGSTVVVALNALRLLRTGQRD